ncbi:hypothetical protein J2S09_001437 [Bacillus fengqiuensis]|nr:hypothetical protein [Bacillus fengqiuensis]
MVNNIQEKVSLPTIFYIILNNVGLYSLYSENLLGILFLL